MEEDGKGWMEEDGGGLMERISNKLDYSTNTQTAYTFRLLVLFSTHPDTEPYPPHAPYTYGELVVVGEFSTNFSFTLSV